MVRALSRLLPPPGPVRLLTAATLVNQIGNALVFGPLVLYLTSSVGYSSRAVGLGLTVAGVVALLASVPMGHFVDRRGPREVFGTALLVEGVAAALYAFARPYPVFLAVACLAALAEQASKVAWNSLVGVAFQGAGRMAARAYLRVTANLAFVLGGVLAGVAVQLDSREAYLAVILGNAVTFLLAAVLVLRLPHYPPIPAPDGGRCATGRTWRSPPRTRSSACTCRSGLSRCRCGSPDTRARPAGWPRPV